jgi:hypothetical protein
MADIVAELRNCNLTVSGEVRHINALLALHSRAADEIERLRSVLTKLDSYMDFGEPLSPCGCWPDPSSFNEAMAEARSALGSGWHRLGDKWYRLEDGYDPMTGKKVTGDE